MKNLILIALTICLATSTFSQRQKVYSIVKQPQSADWYTNQYKLWSSLLEKEPKNAEAWQNAYTAMRMIKIFNAGKTQKDLDVFIKKMQKEIPGTYEYHYLTNYNGNNSDSLFLHVQKAYEMNPERTEVYPDLLTYYLLKENKVEINKYSNLWFNSNDYSPNILNFGYNILASCEDNSILITNGDNDTYPLIIVQNAMKFKENVNVLNIYLLKEKKYRDRVFKRLKIKPFRELLSEFKDQYAFMKAIVRHIENHSEIPLYYSSTVNSKIYEASKEETYIVGLALKYCKYNFDNIAVLKKNIEQNFKLDYLSKSFFNDLSSTIVIRSNDSYLVGLITLYDHYKVAGETLKQQKIKRLLESISETSPNSKYILDYLNKP